MIASDIPALQRMAEASGFPYIDPQSLKVEIVMVAVDDKDKPVAAAAAHRIVEIYAWMDQDQHPALKLAELRDLQPAMVRELRAKGYAEAKAFIPPSICVSFGRRLERSFRWVKNWPSFALRF